MLVVVRQAVDTDPIRVDFITDQAEQLVLHWGVTKPGALPQQQLPVYRMCVCDCRARVPSWKLPPTLMAGVVHQLLHARRLAQLEAASRGHAHGGLPGGDGHGAGEPFP